MVPRDITRASQGKADKLINFLTKQKGNLEFTMVFLEFTMVFLKCLLIQFPCCQTRNRLQEYFEAKELKNADLAT